MHKDDALQMPHSIVSAGVDWITCTRSREWEDNYLQSLALDIMEEEVSAGNELRPWRTEGYTGYQCGSVRMGVRHDTWILQLSAEVARTRWREAYAVATNVSRLDVQTTVKLEQPCPSIISDLHHDALNYKSKGGRPCNRTLITSTLQGDTLYLGQRTSDVYMRAYDKGVEMKSEERGVLLRYECEFKRKPARHLAAQLSSSANEETDALALVCNRFTARRLRVPVNEREWRWDASSLPQSTAERKLRWLRSAVSPSIQFLLSHVSQADIMNALGLNVETATNKDDDTGG